MMNFVGFFVSLPRPYDFLSRAQNSRARLTCTIQKLYTHSLFMCTHYTFIHCHVCCGYLVNHSCFVWIDKRSQKQYLNRLHYFVRFTLTCRIYVCTCTLYIEYWESERARCEADAREREREKMRSKTHNHGTNLLNFAASLKSNEIFFANYISVCLAGCLPVSRYDSLLWYDPYSYRSEACATAKIAITKFPLDKFHWLSCRVSWGKSALAHLLSHRFKIKDHRTDKHWSTHKHTQLMRLRKKNSLKP